MTETNTWLITGANRGIGLELTRQLLTIPTNIVVATCRNPNGATELRALKDVAQGTLHIVLIDVSSEGSIKNSVSTVQTALGEGGIDVLCNNAAIIERDDAPSNVNPEVFLRTMQVNVVGPMLLYQVYLPLLEKGKKKTVINVSSTLASIGLNHGVKSTSYSISKAALNMLTYKMTKDRPEFIAIALDPGWVKTDMGGEGAQLETEFCVSHLIKLITSLKNEDSGKFFTYAGNSVPWSSMSFDDGGSVFNDPHHVSFCRHGAVYVRKNYTVSKYPEDSELKSKVYLLEHFERHIAVRLYEDHDFTFEYI
ncbi:NAD(P)-binding protein [Dichomitus squalens]|uniref:NAD(P)-binding protein n=1 Tax=Dichomitus squalens TaxID=114155 RepID=A0A4Q9MPD6_9APHY|nr:NAD(P)-binding protein [Dichomitus squalens]